MHSKQFWATVTTNGASEFRGSRVAKKTFWTLCFSVCCSDFCPFSAANNLLECESCSHNPTVLSYTLKAARNSPYWVLTVRLLASRSAPAPTAVADHL